MIDTYKNYTAYDKSVPNIQRLAYELYKTNWMARISTERQLDALKNYYELQRESEAHNQSYSYDMNDYIQESGYDGEIYACFDEFLDNEYLDKDIMRGLLNDAQYDNYLEDLNDFYIED